MKLKIVEPSAIPWTPDEWFPELEKLVEKCGRICHRSEEFIGDGTAASFIQKVAKKMQHESILEHASVTMVFTCSRACSHQLVRHRLAAYSQESQRWCDYSKDSEGSLRVIVPPSLSKDQVKIYLQSVTSSYAEYCGLRDCGVPPEDARYLLPNATATMIATTYNVRQWRHVLKMRLDKHAQWEIKDLMRQTVSHLGAVSPVFFGDLVQEYE